MVPVSKTHYSHLSTVLVPWIRTLIGQGLSDHAIFRETGVSRATIALVRSNRWRLVIRDKPVDEFEGLSPEHRSELVIRRAKEANATQHHPYRAHSLSNGHPNSRNGFTDNLIISLRYVWRGILAEEAGLSVAQEDRE